METTEMNHIYFKLCKEPSEKHNSLLEFYDEVCLLDIRIASILTRRPYKLEVDDDQAEEVYQYKYEYMLKGKKQNGNWEIFFIWDQEDFFTFIDHYEIPK